MYIDKLIKESGNSTIRIFFYNKSKELIQKTRDELKKLGCDSEARAKSYLVAVDVPFDINYKKIILPYLRKGAKDDTWDFEEACLGGNVSN